MTLPSAVVSVIDVGLSKKRSVSVLAPAPAAPAEETASAATAAAASAMSLSFVMGDLLDRLRARPVNRRRAGASSPRAGNLESSRGGRRRGQPRLDAPTALGARPCLELPAERLDALAHAVQPKPRARARERGRRTAAVVADVDRDRVV